MARLILSNLCLSFNILLLNPVLRKTPSTLISSRGDLIKPVPSFLGLLSHLNHILFASLASSPEMLLCAWVCSEAAILSFQGSKGSSQAMCFFALSETLVCTNGATIIMSQISTFSLWLRGKPCFLEGGAAVSKLCLPCWISELTSFMQKCEETWRWQEFLVLIYECGIIVLSGRNSFIRK